MKQFLTDVAIVGAGPSGLVMARLLARCGVRSVVLEQRAGLHRAPQAHVISARSMEVFHSLGLDQKVRSAAVPVQRLRNIVWCSSLAGVEFGRLSVDDMPQDDPASATSVEVTNLAQNLLEPILLDGLEEGDHVRVLFSSPVLSITQDDSSVLLETRDDAGNPLRVTARYAIGADGAGSFVRRAMGIEFEGPKVLARFLSIHFKADVDRYIEHRPGPLYWTFSGRPGVFIAYDVGRTFVFMTPYHANADRPEDFGPKRCAEMVRTAIGDRNVSVDLRDINTWIMSAQVAKRYREGRVFLIGDAAHRFPPTGGLGMNTGIHDATNLAWKLSLVVRGEARPELLDSYEKERRPIAQLNADQSVRNFRRMDDVWQAFGLDPQRLEKLQWLLEGDLGARLPRLVVRALIHVATYAALRSMRRLRPGDEALELVRERLDPILKSQAEHFDFHGLDLGQHYPDGCVVPDGTRPPLPPDPVRQYLPNACPGSRLPVLHSAIAAGPARVLEAKHLTLLFFGASRAWTQACDATRTLGWDLHWLDLSGQLDTAQLRRYAEICGVASDGALLVRPDSHVAARYQASTGERLAWLTGVLDQLRMVPAPLRAEPPAVEARGSACERNLTGADAPSARRPHDGTAM